MVQLFYHVKHWRICPAILCNTMNILVGQEWRETDSHWSEREKDTLENGQGHWNGASVTWRAVSGYHSWASLNQNLTALNVNR